MRPYVFGLSAACAMIVASAAFSQDLADGPSLSPFKDIRPVDGGLEVQIHDATWYALLKIENVETAKLLTESKRLCGGRWWKRVCEDLPALLHTIDEDPGREVDLVVRDLATGERKTFEGVAMTHDKRQALRDRYRGRLPRAGAEAADAAARSAVSAADARSDLEALERLLRERYSYFDLRGVKLTTMLRQARKNLKGDRVDLVTFAREIDRIMNAFGDGHSGLRGGLPPEQPGYLPFLVQQVDGGAAAFLPDRSGLVDAEHPFVTAIDGVKIERWLAAAAARGRQGSEMMRYRESERGLRTIGVLRRDLELPAGDTLDVELRGKGGTTTKTMRLSRRKPIYGSWPRAELRAKTIERDGRSIGYLRIGSMMSDEQQISEMESAMRSFSETDGLVIDVRGNGGGSRQALRILLPYLLAPDADPVVTNVGALRLPPGEAPRGELLSDRGLHPIDWDGYDDAERSAIADFLKTFKPSWRLPRGKFSPLHFLVQRHADNENAYHYDKKVCVLIDRGCYSATDIFAAAFGVLPQVTLVGETTMGGSGRARTYQLPASGLRLKLSSMASFQPNGTLFEHSGVVPDVAVEAQASDLIGETDTVLDRAIDLLR